MSKECNTKKCPQSVSETSDIPETDFPILDIFAPKSNIFDKIVINGLSLVCFVSSMLLIVGMCAVTFVRYVIQGDLYGFEDWVKLFAFWLYFAGAAIGAYNRSHVSADLVTAYCKDGKLKQFLVFLKNLLTVGSILIFVYYAWDFFYFGYMGPLGTGIAIPKTPAWKIPLWTGYIAVFVGFCIMAIYFIRDLVLSAMILFGRKTK